MPGLHFKLPISARDIITSYKILETYQQWFIQLTNAHNRLKKNLEVVDRCVDQIEGGYKDLIDQIYARKTHYIGVLSQLKTELEFETLKAIEDTRFHALEYNTFAPQKPLSQIIWYYTSLPPESLQVFNHHVEVHLEAIAQVFQVSFAVDIQGFEHLNLTRESDTPKQEIAALKEEVMELSQRLDDTEKECAQVKITNTSLEESLNSLQISNQAEISQRAELDSKLTQLEQQIKEKDTTAALKQSEFDALVTKLSETELKNTESEQESQQVQERHPFEKLKGASAAISIAKANFDSAKNELLEQIEESSKALKERQTDLRETTEHWKTVNESAESIRHRFMQKRQRLSDLEVKIPKLEAGKKVCATTKRIKDVARFTTELEIATIERENIAKETEKLRLDMNQQNQHLSDVRIT